MTRHLQYICFWLQVMLGCAKKWFRARVTCRSGVLATSCKDAIDLLCYVRR